MAASIPSATRCHTLIVDDAPAGEDVFGSHAPIADAIYEVITTESGGRTIGLEGSWGSGKSTVVGLLAERLGGTESEVVLFDAWAHEGDPLRRSFLDNLITNLQKKGWVDETAWNKRREELARRRRVEHTRRESEIETPAIVAGAAAVLFAILLSAGVVLLELGLAASSEWPIWVGPTIHVALASLVVLGVVLVWVRNKSDGATGTWLAFLSADSMTRSTSETIESPDPTSIEFESTFNELMREALSVGGARRLVLVVDNIDRVAPEDARSIWATMQTFLHHRHDVEDNWLSSLWVVLPYDRAGIARLWPGSGTPGVDGRPSEVLAESFIQKSIQIRFEVPLPLLSGWRVYLGPILRSALPDCSEADEYAAYRLYAYRLARDGRRAPSPRELKQYVNRIGALHRRWQHELPFRSLAYYASFGVPGTQVAQCLRDEQIPERGVAALLAEDTAAHLAAIAFNTDPTHARQLMLDPLIDRALRQSTSGELMELVNRPGFWEALPQSPIVQPGMGTPTLLTAANRLVDLPVPEDRGAEFLEVTKSIARQGREAEDWPTLTGESAEEVAGILALVHQRAATDIADRITAAAIPPGGAAAWAEGAHALLDQFEWLAVLASGTPEGICDALAHFARLDDSMAVATRLRIDPATRASVDESIITRIGEAPDEAQRALVALRAIESDIEWEPVVTAAMHRLRDDAPSGGRRPPQMTAGDSRHLLCILRAAGDAATEERSALVQEGVSLQYTWLASTQADDEALGDWLYESLRQLSPESRARRSSGGSALWGKNLVDALLSDPSDQPVGALAAAIARRRDFDVIASIGALTEGEALASALVMELWELEGFRGALSGSRFRSLWPHISRAGASSDLNLDELVEAACARPTFVTELESVAFSDDRMGMYGAIITTHTDRSEAAGLGEWAAESLSNLTSDQWQAAMVHSDDWVLLLAAIHNAAPSVRIRGAYAQALARFLEQVAEGREVAADEAEQWTLSLVPLLASAVEGTYVEGVARAAANAGGTLPETFFALVGDTLKEPHILTRPDIRDGLLPNLVTERNASGLSWLITALQDEETLSNAPTDAFDALTEVVRTSVGQYEDIDGQLRQIAALIGLDLEPPPEAGATDP